MNKRPGHVDVTTEVGYCNFCNRTRNLRSEAHHLGTLVRMIVTCETCHRTLSSTMGVAPDSEPEPEPVEAEVPAEKPAAPKRAAAKPAATRKPAAASKPAASKKPAANTKPAANKKPASTATRKATRAK